MSAARSLAPWYAAVLCAWLALGASIALAPAAERAPLVRYMGMHGGKVKLSVNRRTYLLKPGQGARGAVTVLSATPREAILRIGETTYRFRKGSDRGIALAERLVLPRDRSGMFVGEGAINGKPVIFVVDTGATYVTLSAARAKKLRIRYRKNDPIKIATASRTETAYRTRLATVRVGGIVRTDVPAIITRGKHPQIVLLGMSFLSGLEVSHTDDEMTISP